VTAGAPVSRLTELERRYLNGTFAELCRIESPSGRERVCAQRVVAELRALGVTVHEDKAGPLAGSDCGNLLALISSEQSGASEDQAGRGRSVLLCAHLDTVPPQAPVEPVLLEGQWQNANEGILGADNKAAIAVLLTLARHVRREVAPIDLELLFTVGEEVALAGARAFDASQLHSDYGFVFDHASPIGGVVTDSPTHFLIEATFRGAAAHAGIRPEDGRSAILAAARAVASIPHGRVDERTTVNVGTIAGGSAINVVAEECTLTLEARSLEDKRAEEIVAEILDRLNAAANLPDCDCDLDISVQRTFSGYRLPVSSRPVRVAEQALRACGHEPVHISSGGGSDANALIAQGVATVNLANGTERNHEPGESVSAVALEQMFEVALTLLDEAASHVPAAAV
jgi:tripeptide aminopeptidase